MKTEKHGLEAARSGGIGRARERWRHEAVMRTGCREMKTTPVWLAILGDGGGANRCCDLGSRRQKQWVTGLKRQ
jgi:hypothetical protein